MTEASVLSTFMTRLRAEMPEAVVVKHRDASMIGLPDFSVTYMGHVLWGEAKLVTVPKKWDGHFYRQFYDQVRLASPAQSTMMDKLCRASLALYFIWIKKTGLYVVNPLSQEYSLLKASTDGVALVKDIFYRWGNSNPPALNM